MAELPLADAHEQALHATAKIVAAVTAGDLARPTPCEGWDVRTLLNQLVAGNWWVPELAGGKTIAEVGDRLDGDVLGDDPAGAYDASAAAAAAAFHEPGALERPVAVSYGPVPGAVYAGHRLIDVLIHGWDLAVAIGYDTTLDPALVDACWAVVEPQQAMLESTGVFAPHIEVGPDADPQTRLLAALGRNRDGSRSG